MKDKDFFLGRKHFVNSLLVNISICFKISVAHLDIDIFEK